MVWGMSGTLATEHPEDLAFAADRLSFWLDEIDTSANRFRADSELSILNARSEAIASSTFELALLSAQTASIATEGLCDPTVLPSLLALGYDADFADVRSRRDSPLLPRRPAPGVAALSIDVASHRVSLAPGVQLDLGATAKALAADLVADDLAKRGGVLVEIGGDVALRGHGPHGAWSVGVSDTLSVHAAQPRVSIAGGGIATSSRASRTWRAGGRHVHHIIDPRTGEPANGPYVVASVSSESCLRANAFATAALIWGDDAPYHLAQARCAARLVRSDGTVEFVGGWPLDEVAA
jgi:thiamine biosynthesis lipoprotein